MAWLRSTWPIALLSTVLSICLPSNSGESRAGFDLTIADSIRFNPSNGFYEVDVLISKNNVAPTHSTVFEILFSLSFEPAVEGLSFVGVRKPDVNSVFSQPRLPTLTPSAFNWADTIASSISTGETVPDGGATAFTVMMAYTGATAATMKVVFTPGSNGFPTNFYLPARSTEFEFPIGFTNTFNPANDFTVTAVPEPTSVMAAAALSAVFARAIWRRRRLGAFDKPDEV